MAAGEDGRPLAEPFGAYGPSAGDQAEPAACEGALAIPRAPWPRLDAVQLLVPYVPVADACSIWTPLARTAPTFRTTGQAAATRHS